MDFPTKPQFPITSFKWSQSKIYLFLSLAAQNLVLPSYRSKLVYVSTGKSKYWHKRCSMGKTLDTQKWFRATSKMLFSLDLCCCYSNPKIHDNESNRQAHQNSLPQNVLISKHKMKLEKSYQVVELLNCKRTLLVEMQ